MLTHKKTVTNNHSSNAPVFLETLCIFFCISLLLSLFAIVTLANYHVTNIFGTLAHVLR